MKLINHFCYMLTVAVVMVFISTGAAMAGPLSGAIFTTTVDGDVVNGNVIYEVKEDVYLDGGPGPNAPAKAAGLPAGDYYFQVTDPSGKDLLSSDHISCRRVRVSSDGVIVKVYPGMTWVKDKGDYVAQVCKHAEGVDIDHFELGAITVQLFPYDDTPNPGGVYKVWMTPVDNYAGDKTLPVGTWPGTGKPNINGENWVPANVHGFIPSWSKTDNYKVDKKGKPFDSPEITVLKFHDRNFNCLWEEGEEEIIGWEVDVTDPALSQNTVFTPALIIAEPSGMYTLVEETPADTQQTISTLDGAPVSSNCVEDPPVPAAHPTVLVDVAGDSGETHLVVYGNVGVGGVTACKIFDRNGDGIPGDPTDEPGIEGWKIVLTHPDSSETIQYTESGGCTTFSGLLPGTYTVTEVIPSDGVWIPTAPEGETPVLSDDVTIESSLEGGLHGTLESSTFTNVCTATTDFGTKGFWHNKNGLDVITQADIDYVNTLPPYASESTYFDDGDEPFDGVFTDGTLVAAAHGSWGDLVASEGSPKAEVSQFLVDPNAGGDPREQLAQQLLAFIFNTRHALDSPDAAVQDPDGNFVSAQDLITSAIAIWGSGTDAEQTEIKTLLDWFNNNDAVVFIPLSACAVVYP